MSLVHSFDENVWSVSVDLFFCDLIRVVEVGDSLVDAAKIRAVLLQATHSILTPILFFLVDVTTKINL